MPQVVGVEGVDVQPDKPLGGEPLAIVTINLSLTLLPAGVTP